MSEFEVNPSGWGDADRPIVLVHGAWVGEWSWLPIMGRLLASGRAVHAVSLTGQGARRHESGPHIRLNDHVADVVNLIEVLDLSSVTLVGHSYGGRVITRAATVVGQRLDAMVYLDAHAPTAPDEPQTAERIAAAEANGGMLPFTDYTLDPEVFGGESGVAWCTERLVDQPFACLTDPWQDSVPDHVTPTYLYASGEGPTKFTAYAQGADSDPRWHYIDLPGPHFLMFSHPDEVAEAILGADGRS